MKNMTGVFRHANVSLNNMSASLTTTAEEKDDVGSNIKPKSMKLAIIGAGNMAAAIVQSINKSSINGNSLQNMSDVKVCDLDVEKAMLMEKKYPGLQSVSRHTEVLKDADICLLAIKPQQLSEFGEQLKDHDWSETTLISILAGCPIEKLQKTFPTCKYIVRTMPNTPAAIMDGITVWTATNYLKEDIRLKTKELLGNLGEEIYVSNEQYLDMATAISGSGPAYVYLLTESLVDAGVHIGFPREIATKLAITTIRGSLSYARQSEDSLTELRYNVTSPGGTTASAIYELERGRFRTVISDAVWAAYRRSAELGNLNPNFGPGRNKF